MTTEVRTRLRRLADDCEERARLVDSGEARSLYHLAAREARRASERRHLGERELCGYLAAMTAQAQLARWYGGEADEYEAWARPVERLLNPRQLADVFGMTDRGARKAIERGVRRGLEGFRRDGKRWLAEREAFAQLIINQRADNA